MQVKQWSGALYLILWTEREEFLDSAPPRSFRRVVDLHGQGPGIADSEHALDDDGEKEQTGAGDLTVRQDAGAPRHHQRQAEVVGKAGKQVRRPLPAEREHDLPLCAPRGALLIGIGRAQKYLIYSERTSTREAFRSGSSSPLHTVSCQTAVNQRTG